MGREPLNVGSQEGFPEEGNSLVSESLRRRNTVEEDRMAGGESSRKIEQQRPKAKREHGHVWANL